MRKINILRKTFIASGVITMMFCASCNEEPKEEKAITSVENPDQPELNPEHGLPGHRCDIPVGVPLNTASKQTKVPPTTISPILINQTPAVNPPHGEVGHDCGVPVGSPLG